MNKTQLINAVVARTQHSKAQTAALVDALMGILQESLAKGGSVQLVNFGNFSVTDRPAHE
jgi:DNA-binding protein HU-beta